MHIQTQLPSACSKWAWQMGGGCECEEVKMWLNPLLLFNLRWRILNSNESSLAKKSDQDKMWGELFGPFISQAMGGGCESGEVKMWLNPLLLFDLRWKKTSESLFIGEEKWSRQKVGDLLVLSYHKLHPCNH
jgi:hypothetical protein